MYTDDDNNVYNDDDVLTDDDDNVYSDDDYDGDDDNHNTQHYFPKEDKMFAYICSPSKDYTIVPEHKCLLL